MKRLWQQLVGAEPRRFFPMLAATAALIACFNLLVWLVGDRVFLEQARQLDREKAFRQVARISNLLDREAKNLQRVIWGRADRLGRDSEVQRAGLAGVDFTRSVSEEFLSGVNIDAYLIIDAARAALFAQRREPSTDALSLMPLPEQRFLASLSLRSDAGSDGIAGLAVTPDGSVAMVASVPVGRRPTYGALVACRDLSQDQIATYGEIVEQAFAIKSLESGFAPDDPPGQAVIDDAAGKVVWHLNDLAGRPTLQLTMAYSDEYEKHMAAAAALSRGGALILSLLAGALAAMLSWRRQQERQREVLMHRESERFARLAAVGELAAGIAHEINNPIGMIRHNLDFVRDVMHDVLPLLAERDDADRLTIGGVDFSLADKQLPQLLEDMTRGSRRIGEIVRDLKDFARDDAPDDSAPFALNDAVEAAVRLLDGQIRKATDHLSLRLGDGLPLVYGNLRQVEQVVVNLVQNACQALSDRDGAIAVTTRYDDARRLCLVEVLDEGVGIAPEDRERIFEPFFTTRRDSGGTGLGLSVSLRMVRRHGGQLDFDSSPGRGTRATVSFPIAEERS